VVPSRSSGHRSPPLAPPRRPHRAGCGHGSRVQPGLHAGGGDRSDGSDRPPLVHPSATPC
jgi:hypothetical protein